MDTRMTPADAAELLTLAAAFDRRTVGEADAKAWALALAGMDPRDAAEAIPAHYAASTDWLMPAHVRAGVKRIRAERLRAVDSGVLEPADVDPDDVPAYLAAVRERRRAVAAGVPLPAAVTQPRRPVAALIGSTLRRMPRVPEETT